jgi:hypothetical protein
MQTNNSENYEIDIKDDKAKNAELININQLLLLDKNENNEENSAKNGKDFVNKKRGRKNKISSDSEKKQSIHDKYSDDNLKRKIKTHFHNFIIAFLNMKSKHILTKKYQFGKMSSEITQNITVEYNQKLFEKKMKDIIVEMSDKFQDKDKNRIALQIIMKKTKDNDEIIQLLDTNYKDMYLNYYLKSNKETFKDEASDESYESHLKKLEKLYGKEYIFDYKRNAQELISFFYKIKKRVRNKQSKELIKPQFCHFNNSNLDHNYININSNDSNYLISPKKMTSTSTQTDMIVSEDEDENFIKNILELDLPPL